MKKINQVFLLVFAFVLFAFCISCEKSCDGKGTLKLTNSSLNTVQRIMIDGINYGTLDPDEYKEMSLAVGEHEFQQVGISGAAGCSAAKVIIVECETSAYICKN